MLERSFGLTVNNFFFFCFEGGIIIGESKEKEKFPVFQWTNRSSSV